jgi:hypothetical protein
MSDLRNIATRFVGRATPTLTALLANALALMLCCLCFVGTTFAWFTSSNSSGTSSIVVGNLDVGLYVDAEDNANDALTLESGKNVVKLGDGQNISLANAEIMSSGSETTGVYSSDVNQLQVYAGNVISVPTIYVVNTGTLSAKYQVRLYETGGGSALNSLQFYCSNTEVADSNFDDKNWNSVTSGNVFAESRADSALKGVVEVENNQTPNYQFKELHIYIKVAGDIDTISLSNLKLVLVATQAPDETDMGGKAYDEGAQYDAVVTNEQELIEAIDNADDGSTIQVLCDIDLSKLDEISKISLSLSSDAESNDSNTAEVPLGKACTLVVSGEADSPQSTTTKITYELRISKNINLSFIDSANLTVNRATGAQVEGGEVCTVVIQ